MKIPTPNWHTLPGYMRAPNISGNKDLYEIENLAADPDRTVEAAMRQIAPWDAKVLMDVGAGTGHHIERFHEDAAHVIAVEPDASLRMALLRRLVAANLLRTSVIGASAANIPIRDQTVDVAHARFAYFFGPGCEPGLDELERVMTPGGTAFIIDNDLRSGTFAEWIHAAYPDDRLDAEMIETFWLDHGFTITRLSSCWRFDNRDDLDRVVHLEFPENHARDFVDNHVGLEIDYNLILIHKTY